MPLNRSRTLLLTTIVVLSFAWLNYWSISKDFYGGDLARVHQTILDGTGDAPWQYRVLPVYMAEALSRISNFPIRYAYGLLDMACLAIVVGATLAETRPDLRLQALGLVSFYLLWIVTWYHAMDTLPAAMWLSLGILCFRTSHRAAPLALLLLGLTLPLIRADVAAAFSISLGAHGLLAGRRSQVALAGTLLAFAVIIQAGLATLAFPTAKYAVHAIQLMENLHLRRMLPFLLFAMGALWTIVRISRRPWRDAPLASALAAGAAAHAAMWIVMGKIDEVRIFFPFAIALVPYTAMLLADLDAHNSANG